MSIPAAQSAEIQPILLCLSHLRWDFVFQRPQQLLTRAAKAYRVLFFEEPMTGLSAAPSLLIRVELANVTVVTPQLPPGLAPVQTDDVLRRLLDQLMSQFDGLLDVVWYYTPWHSHSLDT